jgi:hypothetical protein
MNILNLAHFNNGPCPADDDPNRTLLDFAFQCSFSNKDAEIEESHNVSSVDSNEIAVKPLKNPIAYYDAKVLLVGVANRMKDSILPATFLISTDTRSLYLFIHSVKVLYIFSSFLLILTNLLILNKDAPQSLLPLWALGSTSLAYPLFVLQYYFQHSAEKEDILGCTSSISKENKVQKA